MTQRLGIPCEIEIVVAIKEILMDECDGMRLDTDFECDFVAATVVRNLVAKGLIEVKS